MVVNNTYTQPTGFAVQSFRRAFASKLKLEHWAEMRAASTVSCLIQDDAFYTLPSCTPINAKKRKKGCDVIDNLHWLACE